MNTRKKKSGDQNEHAQDYLPCRKGLGFREGFQGKETARYTPKCAKDSARNGKAKQRNRSSHKLTRGQVLGHAMQQHLLNPLQQYLVNISLHFPQITQPREPSPTPSSTH